MCTNPTGFALLKSPSAILSLPRFALPHKTMVDLPPCHTTSNEGAILLSKNSAFVVVRSDISSNSNEVTSFIPSVGQYIFLLS